MCDGRMTPTWIRMLFSLACAATTAGCAPFGRIMLTADDAIARPDGNALLSATLFRSHGFPWYEHVGGIRVSFAIGGAPVGWSLTDDTGQAAIEARVPPGVRDYSVTVQTGPDAELTTSAGVYHWSTERTIIAVDIDETISATDYADLFFGPDDDSRAIPGTQAALRRLAQDYHIMYFTARPRILQDKTRAWLRKRSFPPGPYVGADLFDACFHQEEYKRRMLAELKAEWPNLLIGIGDKKVDDNAYGANGMMVFIINPAPVGDYALHCRMMRNWDELVPFFEHHQRRLSHPRRLQAVLAEHHARLPAVFESPPAPGHAPAQPPPEAEPMGRGAAHLPGPHWPPLLVWLPRTLNGTLRDMKTPSLLTQDPEDPERGQPSPALGQ